jgi:hypothetical protein
MSKRDLKALTTDQLVDRFAEIGIAQNNALWDQKYAVFNRLYDQMDEVDQELRSRGRAARAALSRLFTHPDVQVRLQAAKWSLGVVPEAYQVIKEISQSNLYPQAGEAGMTLRALDQDIFKPD